MGSIKSNSNGDVVEETTPLLPREEAKPDKPWRKKSVLNLALLVAFLVSLSFGVTQVP